MLEILFLFVLLVQNQYTTPIRVVLLKGSCSPHTVGHTHFWASTHV